MRKTFTLAAALCAGLLLSPAAGLLAQSLDPSFLPTVLKGPMSLPLQSGVNTLAVQPDGKIIAAGGFDFVNGTLTGRLQRFNTDGTVDATFNAGTGANGFITAVAVQPDGKILVAGGFNLFNGVAGANMVRLNANGSLDTGFSTAGTGLTRQPMSLTLQADGKILVGGAAFDLVGLNNPGLIRLNANGSKDTSFNPGTGNDGGVVYATLVQPDGKILVGGTFSYFNGQDTGSLTRLNADGSADASFSVGGSQTFNGTVRALVRQASGKILVGGNLLLGSGTGSVSTRLVRLLPTGASDNTFTPGAGPNNGSINSMVQQSTGAVLLAGSFTQYDGVARGRVARISADGVLDATFAPAVGANNMVQTLVETSTGQVLVGGTFSQYNGTDQAALARLSASGSLDLGFAPLLEARGSINQAFALSTGQLLVVGNMNAINGNALTGLATLPRRFNTDGSYDPSYVAAAGGNLQAVLPGGSAYLVDNTGTVRRLQASGSLDNSFTMRTVGGRYGSGSSTGPANLTGATVQPDGKVLAFGAFSSYDGVPRNGLVRLLADGSLDASFTPPASAALPAALADFRRLTAVHVLPSGKILCQWTAYLNTSQPQLTRLNADGTLDNTFSIGTGPTNAAGQATFFSVLPLAGDKVLLWNGDFTSVNGQSTPYGITRLTATGAVDPTFSGLTEFYRPRYVQADGRIIATTGSTALANANSQIVRLNTDGSLDTGFAPVAMPTSIFTGDDVLTGVTQQPTDGKLILYGTFRYVAGQPRIGLARLTNTTVATKPTGQLPQPLTLYPNPTRALVTVQLPAAAEQLRLLDLQGRLVQQHRLPTRQTTATVDLSGVRAGLYLVQVVGASSLYQQRVVVTH